MATTKRRSTGLEKKKNWRFVTNHGVALLVISQENQITALDLSRRLGITERSVRSIIKDLEQSEYIHKKRAGRKNIYSVNESMFLRHTEIKHAQIHDLLALLRIGN